jgi:hypothetical protein
MDGEGWSIEALDWERRSIDRRLLRDHRRLNDSRRPPASAAVRAVTLAASALGVEYHGREPRARRHEEKRHTEPRHGNPCYVLYNDPI